MDKLGRVGKEGSTIELRACETVSEDNMVLIKKIAQITKIPTIGYTGNFIIIGQGKKYIAYPDGTVKKVTPQRAGNAHRPSKPYIQRRNR